MAVFTEAEADYLDAPQRLGRLATIGPDGTLRNKPVTFRVDREGGRIVVGGHGFGRSRKYKDVLENPVVAFVVDDVPDSANWNPRGVEIRGDAVAHDRGGAEVMGAGWDEAWLEIVPSRVVAWGIDSDGFRPNARSV